MEHLLSAENFFVLQSKRLDLRDTNSAHSESLRQAELGKGQGG